MIDAGLIIAYVLVGISILAAVGLPLVQAAGNLKSLKKAGISVGGLLVLFLVCYALSSDDTMGSKMVTAAGAKRVGAGLLSFYVLLAIALVSIVYTEISKISK